MIVKLLCRPIISAWRRSSFAPMLWKVPSHGMPSTADPSIAPMRSRISRAALLVKVTARISDGHAWRVYKICAIRAVKAAVLPVPAPASRSTGPSVVSTASRCGGFNPRNQGGSVCDGSVWTRISDIGEQLGNNTTNRKRCSVTWCNYDAPQGRRTAKLLQAVIVSVLLCRHCGQCRS